MQWLTVINGLGVLAGAAYTGFAFSPSHTPLWAGLATLLFLIALFIPLAAEYSSLDQGFRNVGDGFVETRQRERGMGPKMEILTNAPQPPIFRRSSRANLWAVAVFICAVALIAFDIWERQSTLPPAPKSGVISNY